MTPLFDSLLYNGYSNVLVQKVLNMEIRAIYEKGILKLIDPVDLEDGQQVKLTLLTSEEIDVEAKLAAAGLLAEFPDEFEEVHLSEEEIERLGKLFASEKSVEQDIDEDRGEF
jgi:predicted DNA-binding antitoxin AbrB/MazE fold protein